MANFNIAFLFVFSCMTVEKVCSQQDDPETSFTLSSQPPQTQCDQYKDACSMAGYDVAKITCTRSKDEDPACICKNADDTECIADINDKLTALVDGLQADEVIEEVFTSSMCEEYCEILLDSASCSRWRWDQDSQRTFGSANCTMRASPCPSAEFCDNQLGIKCKSGELGCQETPLAGGCYGNISFSARPSAVHWACQHDNEGATHEPIAVNIYADRFVPIGTYCYTLDRCLAWNDNMTLQAVTTIEADTTTDTTTDTTEAD